MNIQEIGWRNELNSSGSGFGQVVNCCEHGNEPLDFCKISVIAYQEKR
jgi:hypothetical protein